MGILSEMAKGILGPAESAAPEQPTEPRYETKTIELDVRGVFGPHKDMKKLERLLAEGWEIVSERGTPFGTRRTVYALRRETR